MKYLLSLLLTCSLIVSCKNKQLFKDFTLGDEETQWKNNIQKGIQNSTLTPNVYDGDTVSYRSNIKYGLDSIPVNIAFNNDGVPFGKLRIITMSLNDSTNSKVVDSNEINKLNQSNCQNIFTYGDKATNELILWYSICPKNRFEKCLSMLTAMNGKCDSTTYTIKNRDTLNYHFHFHNANSTFILTRDIYNEPSNIVPFQFCSVAYLTTKSNEYEKELQTTIADKKMRLKPLEAFSFKGKCEIKEEVDKYGFTDTKLKVSIPLNDECRTSKVENRAVTGMKGTIIFKDAFNEKLDEIQDIEINNIKTLNGEVKAGYNCAVSNTNSTVNSKLYVTGKIFREYLSAAFEPIIYPFHKDRTNKFKFAVKNHSKIHVEYVPTVIVFEDGAIWK